MRLLHRYIGYFMAGIMAVYAISGVLLIYRDTSFLKKEKKIETKIEANIPLDKLGKELKIKGLEVKEQKGDLIIFKEGTYNSKTGEAKYTKKELPFFLKKMTGKTFFSYLAEYRIESSCQMLTKTNMAIAEICFASGFKDIPYYNRVFKKIKAVTPTEYRERI